MFAAGAGVRGQARSQFGGAVGALELTLDTGVLDRLDECFPGPQPAPELQAW